MDDDDDDIFEEFRILKTFIGYFFFFLMLSYTYKNIKHIQYHYRMAKAMAYDPNSWEIDVIKMRHQKHETVLNMEVMDNVKVEDLSPLVERLKMIKIALDKYRVFMHIPEIEMFTEDALEGLSKIKNKKYHPDSNTTMPVIADNSTAKFIF